MENSRKPWWDTQEAWYMIPHTVPKFQNKYSQKWNCAVSFPISTFLYLWVIYIFLWSIRLFCCIAFVDRSWEYLNRSQIHECRNWKWGRTVLFWGIFVSTFQDSAFAMQPLVEKILDLVSGRRRTTPATLLYSLLVNGKLRKPWRDTQEAWYMIPHTVPKIWNKSSQKWICAASFPISTFLYLRAIYIFPRSVRLFAVLHLRTDFGNI